MQLSKELQAVANGLDQHEKVLFGHTKYLIGKDIDDIHQAMKFYYGDMIQDDSQVKTCFTTNSGYVGLRTPMNLIPATGKFEPTFSHRYFTEDIPYGLCVVKGIADLVGEQVPFLDKVVEWAQTHMNKQFILHGKLQGKDLSSTTAPQAFNIHT